jgi:hypothetical protein
MLPFDIEIVKLYFEATSGNWCMEFWSESSEAVKFYFANFFDCWQYFDRLTAWYFCHLAAYIMAPNWLVLLQFIAVMIKKEDLGFSGENKKQFFIYFLWDVL